MCVGACVRERWCERTRVCLGVAGGGEGIGAERCELVCRLALNGGVGNLRALQGDIGDKPIQVDACCWEAHCGVCASVDRALCTKEFFAAAGAVHQAVWRDTLPLGTVVEFTWELHGLEEASNPKRCVRQAIQGYFLYLGRLKRRFAPGFPRESAESDPPQLILRSELRQIVVGSCFPSCVPLQLSPVFGFTQRRRRRSSLSRPSSVAPTLR